VPMSRSFRLHDARPASSRRLQSARVSGPSTTMPRHVSFDTLLRQQLHLERGRSTPTLEGAAAAHARRVEHLHAAQDTKRVAAMVASQAARFQGKLGGFIRWFAAELRSALAARARSAAAEAKAVNFLLGIGTLWYTRPSATSGRGKQWSWSVFGLDEDVRTSDNESKSSGNTNLPVRPRVKYATTVPQNSMRMFLALARLTALAVDADTRRDTFKHKLMLAPKDVPSTVDSDSDGMEDAAYAAYSRGGDARLANSSIPVAAGSDSSGDEDVRSALQVVLRIVDAVVNLLGTAADPSSLFKRFVWLYGELCEVLPICRAHGTTSLWLPVHVNVDGGASTTGQDPGAGASPHAAVLACVLSHPSLRWRLGGASDAFAALRPHLLG